MFTFNGLKLWATGPTISLSSPIALSHYRLSLLLLFPSPSHIHNPHLKIIIELYFRHHNHLYLVTMNTTIFLVSWNSNYKALFTNSNASHNFLGHFPANLWRVSCRERYSLVCLVKRLIFIFESPNFVEYGRSYNHLNFPQFSMTSATLQSISNHLWPLFEL